MGVDGIDRMPFLHASGRDNNRQQHKPHTARAGPNEALIGEPAQRDAG